MTKEVHFCEECFNLTDLHTDEEHQLIHVCKSCDKVEKFKGDNNCIYSVDFNGLDASLVINSNKYITHDVTLPTIKNNTNLHCPNVECETNIAEKEKSFKYVKYDYLNMKYIYICDTCGQKWTN